MPTGSPASAFITIKSNYSQYKLKEESSTRLSSPNSNPIIVYNPNSKLSPTPPQTRRNSIILHPPPPTTSIIPPLLSFTPIRQTFNLPQTFPPPPTFAQETLQSQPKLQLKHTITTKTKSRVNKAMDKDSKILDEEILKYEDDVMKNKNRSLVARKELNEYIPKINILNSLQRNSNGITDSTSLKF